MRHNIFRLILAVIGIMMAHTAAAYENTSVSFWLNGSNYGTFSLYAEVDGYTTFVRDFKPDMGALSVYHEADFDGDGVNEGILKEYNPANSSDAQYWLMKYQRNGKFKIYKMFRHYGPVRIGYRGSRQVIEAVDGDRVTARYGFTGSSVKTYSGDSYEPTTPTPATTPSSGIAHRSDSRTSRCKTFHIGTDYNGQINFDFNGDGSVDKLYDFRVSQTSLSCKLNMNGDDYEVYAPISGAPAKLNILKKRTKGMNELLVTGADGSRYRICWNGTSYR